MQFIISFLYIYLLAGFIYGVYVTLWGGGRWYLFPINVLGGPIAVLIILYKSLVDQEFHV